MKVTYILPVFLLCEHGHICNQVGRKEADLEVTNPGDTSTGNVSIKALLLDHTIVMGSALVILCLNP